MITKSKIKVLKQMRNILEESKIKYAFAGPLACYIWGVNREVRDIYIIIEKADLPILIEACQINGIEVKLIDNANDSSNMELAIVEFINQNSIESLVIITKGKMMPPDILKRTVYIEIKQAGKFYVVSPEDSIIIKLMNKTSPDIRDAKQIYKHLHKRLDLKYLRKICKDYNIRHEKYIPLKDNELIIENIKRN